MRPAIEFIKDTFGTISLIGVEVGVQKGRHSEEILKALNVKELWLVDIWDEYNMLVEDQNLVLNFKEYESVVRKKFKNDERIRIIKECSVVASKSFNDYYFNFVYIDANHNYGSVKEDIEAWFPKVNKGGIICGHDYNNEEQKWKGVEEAVNEFVKKHNLELHLGELDWWAIKDDSWKDKYLGD